MEALYTWYPFHLWIDEAKAILQVPTAGLEVSKIFEEFELKKEELSISDWGISQSTLEDVFMEIVEAHENADEPLLQ